MITGLSGKQQENQVLIHSNSSYYIERETFSEEIFG
jgi:hypothetical protein